MRKYVEFNCAFSLKRTTPDEILNALLFMTGQGDDEPKKPPSHSLFNTARWPDLLKSPGNDSDHESYGISGVELSERSGWCRITIRRNLVNFDPEIDQFIQWKTPYIHAHIGDFIGYRRFQDVEPVTLLLYPNRTFARQLPDEIWSEPA
jgi:hypothetical protein